MGFETMKMNEIGYEPMGCQKEKHVCNACAFYVTMNRLRPFRTFNKYVLVWFHQQKVIL